MAKKQKYYAVAKGHQTGIFLNHDDWLYAIQGHKHSRSMVFDNMESAQAYLEDEQKKLGDAENIVKEINEPNPVIIAPKVPRSPHGEALPYESLAHQRLGIGDTVVFTDGSYSQTSKRYGCGAVIFSPDGGIKKFSFSSDDKKYAKYQSRAGEMLAVINVFQTLMIDEVKRVTVFHDFTGVASTAKPTSKPRDELGRFYKGYMQGIILPRMVVTFIHVAGHSGNRFNDMADSLAKMCLE